MKEIKKELYTERLVLRSYRKEELGMLADLLSNKEIRKTYTIPELNNREQAEKLAETVAGFCGMPGHLEYGIFLDNTLIGLINDCGIDDTVAEVGYAIAPDYWGRGFATEAFSAVISELFRVGIKRVEAAFFQGNEASRRVMEKCGLIISGRTEIIDYYGKQLCTYMEITKG